MQVPGNVACRNIPEPGVQAERWRGCLAVVGFPLSKRHRVRRTLRTSSLAARLHIRLDLSLYIFYFVNRDTHLVVFHLLVIFFRVKYHVVFHLEMFRD